MQIKHTPNWTQTSLNTPVEIFEALSKDSAPILLIGGVHGDEPEGVFLAHSLLNWLRTVNTPISWILIPCINPDGFSKNQRVNARGVDLNRNYPSRGWSPNCDNERYFPGPSPNSEPETQALTQLINEKKPQLIIHFHSWKPCIVLTGSPGLPFAQHLQKSSGYEIQDSIGYPTPGSLSEYGWNDLNIPIICIEEEENLSQEQVWPKWAKGFEGIFL